MTRIKKLSKDVRDKYFTLKGDNERKEFLNFVYSNTMIDRGSDLDSTLVDLCLNCLNDELLMKMSEDASKIADEFFNV